MQKIKKAFFFVFLMLAALILLFSGEKAPVKAEAAVNGWRTIADGFSDVDFTNGAENPEPDWVKQRFIGYEEYTGYVFQLVFKIVEQNSTDTIWWKESGGELLLFGDKDYINVKCFLSLHKKLTYKKSRGSFVFSGVNGSLELSGQSQIFQEYAGLTLISGERNSIWTKDEVWNGSSWVDCGSFNKYSHITYTKDVTGPEINVTDGYFYNTDKKVTFSDAGIGVAEAKYSRSAPGAAFPANAGTAFASGTTFAEEGNYTVVLKDVAGNTTKRKFTVDKTKPTVVIHGRKGNGGYVAGSDGDFFNGAYITKSDKNYQSGTAQYRAFGGSAWQNFSYYFQTVYYDNTKEDSGIVYYTDRQSCADTIIPGLQSNIVSKTNWQYSRYQSLIESGQYKYGAGQQNLATTGANYWLYPSRKENNKTLIYFDSANLQSYITDINTGDVSAYITTEPNQILRAGGEYKFTVKDKAGNTTVKILKIDMTKPVISCTTPNNGFTNVIRTIFNTDVNPIKIEYLEPGTSSWKVAAGANQMNMSAVNGLWQFKATDKAGNVSEIYKVTFDNVKPTVSCDVPNNGYTNRLKAVTGADTNYRKLQYMKPGTGSWADVTGTTYTYTAVNGLWKFRATDKAGNISDEYKITFDNIKPVLSSTIPPGSFVNTQKEVRASDINHLNFSYKEPGKDWVAVSDTAYTGAATNGLWQFKATDKAGNVSDVYQFTFDDVKPTLSIVNFSSGGFTCERKTVKANDTNFLKIRHKAPGQTGFTDVTETSYQIDEKEGLWTFSAEDRAGNLSAEYILTYDVTKPTVSCAVPNNGYTNRLKPVTGADTNYRKLQYMKPGTAGWADVAETTYTFEAVNGLWKFRAVDKAGNISDEYHITYDDILPVIGLRKSNNEMLVTGGFTNTGVYFVPQDVNYDRIVLQKNTDGAWQVVTSDYIVGSVYYDEREPLILYSTKSDALSYVISKENTRKAEKENWKPEVQGIIPDSQADLAVEGLAYYEYSLTDGEKYIFFDNDELNKFIKETANGYIRSDSREVFSEEGYYKITAYDRAGNSSYKEFTIDRQVPTGAFVNLANGAVTNAGSVSFRFEKPYVTVTDSVRGQTGTLTQTYEPETRTYRVDITSEGLHTLKLEDRAGNIATYEVRIDRAAAKAIYGKTELAETTYSNMASYTLSVQDDHELKKVSLNGTDEVIGEKARTHTLTLEAEMKHTIVTKDRAGNVKTYYIYLDRTVPVFEFDSNATVEENKIYTNKKFRLSFSDTLSGITADVTKNVLVNMKTQKKLNIASGQDINVTADGEYKIEAVDKAGNKASCTLYRYLDNEFPNTDRIVNQYKLISWYRVVLPDYVFNIEGRPNTAGTYVFEKRESALDFAVAKETEYRVQEAGSNEWIYVSFGSESVQQRYTKHDELMSAVRYYAGRYISERIIHREYDMGSIGTIMNDAGEPDDTGFTDNMAAVPAFLEGYRDYPVYQLKHSFVFSSRQGKFGVRGQTKVTYLADDFSVQNEKTFESFANESILEACIRNEFQKQGYYLVTEYDKCQNEQKYLVYLDFEKPCLRAEVVLGNNTKETVDISAGYCTANSGIMRYTSFSVKDFMDNIDTGYTVMKITGRGLDNLYIKGDNIPTLAFSNGYYGAYQIMLYDRSYNVLAFQITVAGNIPKWTFSSLSPKTEKLTVTFDIADRLNAFEAVELYKVAGDGAKTKLGKDDLDNEINTTRLSYFFTKGGKYQARMVDLFGRDIWTKPIFYERGLPFGALSVSDESFTNRDVTFRYDYKFGLVVYEILAGGEDKRVTTEYITQEDDIAKISTVTFTAKEGLERNYMLFLYDKNDSNLFMEYTFGIDTVISPSRIIENTTGKEISKGGSTNRGFRIECEDIYMSVRYKLAGQDRYYERGTVLDKDGLYLVYLRDKVGNKEEFNIYVDTKVSYRLQGGYTEREDGSILSNTGVSVEVQEVLQSYSVNGDNSIRQGEPFNRDGEYSITMKDSYGNVEVISIVIDTVAPAAKLTGVQSGGRTKDKVQVEFEAGASAHLYRSYTLLKELENEEYIDSAGTYRVVVQDEAGNKTTLEFEIDRDVSAALNIANMSITNNSVYLSAKENIEVDVYLNGKKQEPGVKYETPGEYKLVVTDSVKNTKEYNFLIIGKGYRELKLEPFANSRLIETKKDGLIISNDSYDFGESGRYELKLASPEAEEYRLSFVIDSDRPEVAITYDKKNAVSFRKINKDNVSCVLYKNGVLADGKFDLSSLNEAGSYELRVYDSYGNQNSYTFEIKKKLNTAGIVGIAIAAAIVSGVLIFGIFAKKIKSH